MPTPATTVRQGPGSPSALELALALATAGAALAGCATVPPCPEKGGPTWRAFTSEHFVLRSDLQVDDAVDVIRTLEETRAAMLAAVWDGVSGPPESIQVVALASRGELAAFISFDLAGLHTVQSPFPGLLVISGAYHDGGSTAKHELAHHLSRHFLPLQPDWYAEGMASYLQSTRYDRERGRSVVGEAVEELHGVFRHVPPLERDALFSRTPSDPLQMPRFYATSWLLVHYLINQREARFRHFQHRLGALEPADAAFRAEFPDLDSDGLVRTLVKYADGARYWVTSRITPAWTGAPRIRILSDTEVHGVRALLYATATRRRDPETLAALRAEVDEALRAPAPSVDALAVAAYVPELSYGVARSELAARAVKTDRENWMAWLMTADAAPTPDAASLGALIKAHELAPDNGEIGARLAVRKAAEGHWSEALALSNRVLAVGVLHPGFWLVHLRALIETGHCPEAARWRAALAGFTPAGGRYAQDLASAAAGPCPVPARAAAPGTGP